MIEAVRKREREKVFFPVLLKRLLPSKGKCKGVFVLRSRLSITIQICRSTIELHKTPAIESKMIIDLVRLSLN